jgi:hypothetical protein
MTVPFTPDQVEHHQGGAMLDMNARVTCRHCDGLIVLRPAWPQGSREFAYWVHDVNGWTLCNIGGRDYAAPGRGD